MTLKIFLNRIFCVKMSRFRHLLRNVITWCTSLRNVTKSVKHECFMTLNHAKTRCHVINKTYQWAKLFSHTRSGFPLFLTLRDYNNPPWHECRCRIYISHPRGRNFSQGRGLSSSWLNSETEGEISLSHIDRLMMDCFSPTFSKVFWSEHKKSIKREHFNHLLKWFMLLTRKHEWSIT